MAGWLAWAIPAAASVAGSVIGAKGAKDAAKDAKKGSQAEIDFMRETRDLSRADSAPYRYGGYEALDAAMSLTGLPSIRGYIPPFDGKREPILPKSPTGEPSPDMLSSPSARGQRSGLYSGASRNSSFDMADQWAGHLFPMGGRDFAPAANSLWQSIWGNGVSSDARRPPIEMRADGGPVRKGQTYMVNEKGPEKFYPKAGNPRPVGDGRIGLYRPKQDGYVVPENPGGQPGRYQFQADPGYNFRVSEGIRALDRSAASRGALNSGYNLRRLTRYGQDYASNEYQNVFSRIASIAGLAQPAFNNANQANLYTGQGMASAARNSGFANAAGTMGVTNAVQRGINDLAQGGVFTDFGNWLQGGSTTVPSNTAASPQSLYWSDTSSNYAGAKF